LITGHGGNIFDVARRIGCSPADIHDMSSNMNPLGPLPGLMEHLREQMDTILALPQADASDCINAFARRHRVDPGQVVAANGTTQLIYQIPRALDTKKALILGPTYADYADACRMNGVPYNFYLTTESESYQPDLNRFQSVIPGADTIFICNPNNPTGTLVPYKDMVALCRRNPDKRFVIDEAYMPFVGPDHQFTMMKSTLSNVLVLNSMSKIFRIPGLRIGFMVAPHPIADRFRRYLMPWSLNSLAQAAIIYLMEQKDQVGWFIKKTQQFLNDERSFLNNELNKKEGVQLFPSHTSFILVRLSDGTIAESVLESMLAHRILLRNCANFVGLSDRFVRISLKEHHVNRLLVDAFKDALRQPAAEPGKKVA